MKQVLIWLLSSILLYPQTVSEVNQTKRMENKQKNHSLNADEKLKLMYQVFTYSSDLKHAYQVTKKALQRYPLSLYWHKKAAEVSEWLGKRFESIEHYMFIYENTNDKALEKHIINYGWKAYQYETIAPLLKKKAMEEPSVNNINEMINVYDKIGFSEEAAHTLEALSENENADPYWLKKALGIYIDLGEKESIERIISKIKHQKFIAYEIAQKLAGYYLSIHKIEDSYKTLLRVNQQKLDNNEISYYEQVSDFGWYLKDIENAAKSSKKLYLLGNARLSDYERIIYYFDKKESQLIEDTALDGYEKFNQNYLYIVYLNTLFTQHKYEELLVAFKRISGTAQGDELEQNVYFWLMKGDMYSALKQKENTLDAFKQAMLLEPNSPSITSKILWFFIDNKDHQNLKNMIFDIEEGTQIDSALWLPLAVGNYSLQKADRAMWYIKELMNLSQNNIDIKLMYAAILQTREETDAFMQTMEDVYKILLSRLLLNPDLIKDKDFLERYLKSGLYFMDVDYFENLLKKSQKILKKRNYIELSIFWALKHNAHERTRYLASKLKEIEPWMRLNLALTDDARANMSDILHRHFSVLPIRDRVLTATRTGDLSLAHTLAFEGLENNNFDHLLYKQRCDLIENNADYIDMKTGYLKRGNSLEQSYLNFKNRYYVARAWNIFTNFSFTKNKNRDKKNLQNIPTEDITFDISSRKKFKTGYIDIQTGVRSAMKTYYNFSIFTHYQPIRRMIVEVLYHKNAKAEETTYLLLGGKKDEIKFKASFQYLPSSNISLSLAYDRFYSQDNEYLGDGYYGRAEWYQQLRSGYPDIAWGMFSDFGRFNDKNVSKGTVANLQPFHGQSLPESFYNIGMNFSYGITNKQKYTRVWRPYLELSPYYTSLSNQLNFSFSAGYGGHIYDKDHMIVGVRYNQGLNGTQESSFNFFMGYHMLY